MPSLGEDLQIAKNSLEDFKQITERIINYIPEMITEHVEYGDYIICSSTTAGTRKVIRPYRKDLFIREPNHFIELNNDFTELVAQLKAGKRDFNTNHHQLLDRMVYTIQQSIGIGLDLFVEPNSARKHVGNRFEELMRVFFSEIGIPVKKVILNIPYETEEGEETYKCETDVILSPYQSVKSDSTDIEPKEIVISLKTTTKDRMPKIFIDKILMEKFLNHPIKMVGISQNDVQRMDSQKKIKISYTFVPNLFMVYTKFLTMLDGYYYLDVPRKATEAPFNQHIFPFSKFVLKDLWELLDT